MSKPYLQAIDEINKAACAVGALAIAIETGTVYDLTACRRLIQDNAPPSPEGRILQVKHAQKLQ